MRVLAFGAIVLSATAFAQDLDINGYSNVVIPRSQGDYANYNAALRDLLRDVPFELHRTVEEIHTDAWPKTLYMTAGVDFGRLELYVAVYDVATQTRVARCTSALRGFGERALRTVMKRVIDDMGYRGFAQPTYEANARARTQQSATPEPAPLLMRCAGEASQPAR